MYVVLYCDIFTVFEKRRRDLIGYRRMTVYCSSPITSSALRKLEGSFFCLIEWLTNKKWYFLSFRYFLFFKFFVFFFLSKSKINSKQGSISLTFYVHLCCTKAHFWCQNCVQKCFSLVMFWRKKDLRTKNARG